MLPDHVGFHPVRCCCWLLVGDVFFWVMSLEWVLTVQYGTYHQHRQFVALHVQLNGQSHQIEDTVAYYEQLRGPVAKRTGCLVDLYCPVWVFCLSGNILCDVFFPKGLKPNIFWPLQSQAI